MAIAIAGGALALLALSGGTSRVPETPRGPEGLPTPFLAVATLGSGGPAAGIDAFGSVVELRAPGPAGVGLITTPYKRQRAGSVDANTGITMRASAGERPTQSLWQARPRQRYLHNGGVLETRARLADVEIRARDAVAPADPLWARELVLRPQAPRPAAVNLEVSFNFNFEGRAKDARRVERGPRGSFTVKADENAVHCQQDASVKPALQVEDGVVILRWSSQKVLRVTLLCRAARADPAVRVSGEPPEDVAAAVRRIQAEASTEARRALAATKPLNPTAPAWAKRLYRRSVLTLLALSDRTTGAAPAALRDHWHYIWPRDAATVAFALSQVGLQERAARIADFVTGLDAERAARFDSDGTPIDDGRHEQGDGAGWTRLAERAAAGKQPGSPPQEVFPWRDQGDYGERDGDRGDYLANAIVAGASAAEIEAEFARGGKLLRESAGADSPTPDRAAAPGGGDNRALDTAAAWAVRPFPRPQLFPLVRATLLELASTAGPYGLFPATDWKGRDPWTAATASTAWSLAALGERPEALRLMRAVNRAATPLGHLPERADIENGLPRSTTPLAWSHAFAVLALQELWPPA